MDMTPGGRTRMMRASIRLDGPPPPPTHSITMQSIDCEMVNGPLVHLPRAMKNGSNMFQCKSRRNHFASI